MQTISCPICETDHTQPLQPRQKRGLSMATVVCRGCGLTYHNPVIEDVDREALQLSHRQLHTEAAPTARQLQKIKRRWERQWPLIQPVFQPQDRVLEIGCGLGQAGGSLKALGARVLGVEPDAEQAAYARSRWGLEVVQGRFEEVDLTGEKFDLILASHVIEHFPEPLAFLAKLRGLSLPHTRLFLETPNILAPKVGPRRVFSLAHNFYFSPRTLTWLLLKSGWQVERMRVWRRDAFQVLALPGPAQNPAIPKQAAREVLEAIRRHRYAYYLKLLFIWRKIPWWQKYWMYTAKHRD